MLNLAEGMGDIHSAPFMSLSEETKKEQIYWPHFACRNTILGLKIKLLSVSRSVSTLSKPICPTSRISVFFPY
jgi:hypothetical protein